MTWETLLVGKMAAHLAVTVLVSLSEAVAVEREIRGRVDTNPTVLDYQLFVEEES